MPLQWRNQFRQSLEEGAGKRCLECDVRTPPLPMCLSEYRHCTDTGESGKGGMVVGGERDCIPIATLSPPE